MQHIVPPNDTFESEFDDTIETHDDQVVPIMLQNSSKKTGSFDEQIHQAMGKL